MTRQGSEDELLILISLLVLLTPLLSDSILTLFTSLVLLMVFLRAA